MFGKETSAKLIQCSMALSEIPRNEGSEVKKSDTVTEWEPARDTYVPTIDPVTGETTVAQMTKISRHTGLKMFDCKLGISTSYAHIVTASADHSLITLNPITMELEKTRPEEAKGRCVPRMFSTLINHWENCAKSIVLDKQYPLSYEMGVFIGTMIGDGWVDANGYSFVACCDESFQKYISEHFVPLLNRQNFISMKQMNSVLVRTINAGSLFIWIIKHIGHLKRRSVLVHIIRRSRGNL